MARTTVKSRTVLVSCSPSSAAVVSLINRIGKGLEISRVLERETDQKRFIEVK